MFRIASGSYRESSWFEILCCLTELGSLVSKLIFAVVHCDILLIPMELSWPPCCFPWYSRHIFNFQEPFCPFPPPPVMSEQCYPSSYEIPSFKCFLKANKISKPTNYLSHTEHKSIKLAFSNTFVDAASGAKLTSKSRPLNSTGYVFSKLPSIHPGLCPQISERKSCLWGIEAHL